MASVKKLTGSLETSVQIGNEPRRHSKVKGAGLPVTATLISGDKTRAYKYLPESVNTFITRERMMAMMTDAGFVRVEQFPMTFGVCVCYRGVVP